MTKLEKVIDDLGRVMACGQTMLDCGTESPMVFKMIRDAADNAIVFLKAQEPVEPVFERQFMSDIEIYDCGKCGASLGVKGIAKYCMKCGQAVKWE